MTSITDVTVEPLNLPMNEPFEISLGTQTEAKNVLVAVETESGTIGYGEGAPIPSVTGETQQTALTVAENCGALIKGEDIENYRRLVELVWTTFPGMVSATFAVETAILDAYCREHDLPLAALFGNDPRPVTTDLTIPIVSPERAMEKAEQAVADGFEHLKIKTGNDLEADIERVATVHESAPDVELKVDANQGWTPKETIRFAAEIERLGVPLALIEQPVLKTDIAGLAQCRDAIEIPIAADETVFTPEDAIRVVREGAADVINVKLGKSGPLAVADIVSIATAANHELMIGCMLESAIGIHTSAHIVAGTEAFEYVDLDGNLLLAEDVIDSAHSPTIEISGPGHGVTPEL